MKNNHLNMLIAKYLIWPLVLLALFFVELSFLPQLLPWGITIDFVFLLVFLSCFFREKNDYFSYFLATIAGGFLDIYSGQLFFGFWILFFVLLAWLIKKMSFLMQGLNVFSFLINFLVAYLFYKFFSWWLVWPNFSWLNFMITFALTGAIGVISFFIYASLHKKKS
ncbi:hypothetical protein COZ78_02435 [bacterium (Candidatus Gribaldobacteria) CG_4_8_14_3_um_filter_42_11]|uniref:Rod shape-determining protein MreD n=1 Tax=bacterium (Candidatus Gribaldobacteria) CG_4_8_14_3_um_filter_42_11 TaxID=2014267 RepID=A0A2M7IY27_9BACT|nr:MAG: hypothetical protein COZ78_02435 [bacterium (Candidatus Gribaldobacteria) CG_4_8_14_3_um_filter_42_11]